MLPSPRGTADADDELIEEANRLADELLAAAEASGTPRQRRKEVRLRRILTSDAGTRLVFALADRALRPVDPAVGVTQLAAIAAGDLGAATTTRGATTSALSVADRTMLSVAAGAGRVVPAVVMAAVAARLRLETADLIWPVDDRPLTRRLARLRQRGRRPNLNLLGEAILGDGEAERRVRAVEGLLGVPMSTACR